MKIPKFLFNAINVVWSSIFYDRGIPLKIILYDKNLVDQKEILNLYNFTIETRTPWIILGVHGLGKPLAIHDMNFKVYLPEQNSKNT